MRALKTAMSSMTRLQASAASDSGVAAERTTYILHTLAWRSLTTAMRDSVQPRGRERIVQVWRIRASLHTGTQRSGLHRGWLRVWQSDWKRYRAFY